MLSQEKIDAYTNGNTGGADPANRAVRTGQSIAQSLADAVGFHEAASRTESGDRVPPGEPSLIQRGDAEQNQGLTFPEENGE